MIPFAITNQIKIGAAILIAVLCFYTGWTVHGWKFNAQIKVQQDEFIAASKRTDESNRKIIQGFQNELASIQSKKDSRDTHIPLVTDNRICFANSGALQLWNEALSSQSDVPKNSVRATQETGGTSVTDADILRNINENGLRWQRLRKQVESIREWDEKEFGPRN